MSSSSLREQETIKNWCYGPFIRPTKVWVIYTTRLDRSSKL